MMISSDAITASGVIARQYTCDGDNLSPPLTFSDIPAEVESLVFMLEDPDAPGGTFVHWILYDMSPATLQIVEGARPLTGSAGLSDFGITDYGGPCPPSGSHQYVFRLYGLDRMLGLPEAISKDEVLQAMEGHVLATAETTGTYSRQNV
jgi:Raf kinase inhibitor-like YbhB/YbcL family protein